MKIYHSVDVFPNVDKPVLTTGTFDGVHLGHQTIISRINNIAKEINGESVLLTFFPHPRMVLHPLDHGLKLLNTPEEKAEQLENAGLDHLIIQPFTPDFSKKSAIEYTRDLLVDKIQPAKIVVGYDHRFGKNREGSIKNLIEYGEMFNFQVEQISAQTIEDVNISSTKIRKAIDSGDIKTANHYLGYNYPITGIVIEGDQIGKQLGYPTANIQPPSNYKLLPANGVYAVKVKTGNSWLNGMLNIGVRPTVNNSGELKIEVNLFDFSGDLYKQELRVELLHRIRDEKKFNSLEELKLQLAVDQEQAVKMLK
ncbi:MAG: bifunctional riboflavin kinase/FAD synthetase [Flavobacteriales bacterium]